MVKEKESFDSRQNSVIPNLMRISKALNFHFYKAGFELTCHDDYVKAEKISLVWL